MVAVAEIPEAPRRFRWSREAFLAAADAGAFGDERVELVDGDPIGIMAEKRPHRSSVRLAADALRAAFGAGHTVDQQMSLPLGPDDVPSPDVLVLRGSATEIAAREDEEGAADVVLLVEIADSRLDTAYAKRGRYALAGIPELWILNLPRRELEVYRRPGPDGYRDLTTLGEDEVVSVGGGEIPVARLLPPVGTG